MDWILAHAEHLTALFGLIAAAWAFLSRLDKTYRRHLADTLVTRTDFKRLESKVDQLVELSFLRNARRRRERSDRSASEKEERRS